MLRAFLDRVVRKGQLQIETASGSRFTFRDGSGERGAVRLADSGAARQLILRPELALGELYMDGRIIVTQGSVYHLLLLLGCNLGFQSPPSIARGYDRLRVALRPLHQPNTARRARRNAAYHYDLDGHLHSLFLDPDMQYSCAYFEYPDHSLEEAQLAKKRHIAAKLLVEPGHCVLDIGSGGGGLACYLAKHCGAKVTGITLSEAQLATATARACCSRGLSQKTEFGGIRPRGSPPSESRSRAGSNRPW